MGPGPIFLGPYAKGVGIMDAKELKKVIETLLFTAQQPVSVDEIHKVIEESGPEVIRETILKLKEEYEVSERGICINEIAGGFQMSTRGEFSAIVRKFHHIEDRQKLSRPSLETLAIIAYRQPVLRSEVETVRGVDVGGVLKTLLEKSLIRVMGRKKAPGNPLIYGTTEEFLRYFGLASLDELPEVEKLKVENESRVGPVESKGGV